MDTIFALATAQGKAGVAVVRVSGPDAFLVSGSLCELPQPRRPSVRKLSDSDGELIDEALVLVFEKNASFTGEPVVEFQTHGSVAVVRAVLDELSRSELARLAEPGEFTRRALENGCLDLTQVEGLGDLIEAETEQQRKQAQRVLSGALRSKTESWRADLIHATALLEATIDFADEEVPVDVSPEVLTLLERVLVSIQAELSGFRAAERIRTGFEVAIVGRPNVGKSTLLNFLAGRKAALTSEIAGTTRDVIEVRMDLGGLPVTFLDTAGVRETSDIVEALGVEAALERAKNADLRIFLLKTADEETPIVPLDQDIAIVGKVDTPDQGEGISGVTGNGVQDLVEKIERVLNGRAQSAGLATTVRHKTALARSLLYLKEAAEIVRTSDLQYDLAAMELRSSVSALESLIGFVGIEQILGDIFSRFCLGK